MLEKAWPLAHNQRVSARLTQIDGVGRGRAYGLGETDLGIGRAPESAIVLESPEASRHHARISRKGAEYALEDLGSKNGTLLNGEPVRESVVLRPRDEIGLPGVTFRFELEDVTATRLASPGPAQARLRLDANTAEVVVGDRPVRVTAKEFRALSALFARRGSLVTKEDLAESVWPEYKGDVGDYNIEQLISRLRRKLEDDPAHPRYLVTHRGMGYRLVSE